MCRFAGRYETCQRTGDNHDERSFNANVEAHGGIDEHRGLEETCAHFLMSDGGIHIEVGTDAKSPSMMSR